MHSFFYKKCTKLVPASVSDRHTYSTALLRALYHNLWALVILLLYEQYFLSVLFLSLLMWGNCKSCSCQAVSYISRPVSRLFRSLLPGLGGKKYIINADQSKTPASGTNKVKLSSVHTLKSCYALFCASARFLFSLSSFWRLTKETNLNTTINL